MKTLSVNKSHNAVNLSFTESKMIVFIEDGRGLSIPLELFPKLRNASMKELNNWRLIGNGEGIHWEDLD